MELAKGHLYHVFNQGNNRQKIFFKHENYLFFIEKIRKYILPYADILAWTLMPNHFHLMILVNEEELLVDTHGVTSSHPVSATESHPVSKTRTINNSIAILLRSYTRAINKQNNTSGSLFREGTKAECITCRKGITHSYYNTNKGTIINISDPEKGYPQVCFEYIHQNPVKAGLVENAFDWEYSSAMDYAGLRNGKLINKEIAEEFVSW